MEKVSQTPHDAVFRQMLMHQAVAKDFLQLYLPAPFLAICELDSLQMVSGSFVEEDLRASYSDILYSLRTRHGPGYVYALIEHQSTPDKLMAFRLLRYALAAMQRHLDAGHDTLPLVVPILFYHGKVSPWPWARNWQQLFADPALAKALYSNDFPLVDLTVMPDNQIGHAGAAAKAYPPSRSGRAAGAADCADDARLSDRSAAEYAAALYVAGGNYGTSGGADPHAGGAVAQA